MRKWENFFYLFSGTLLGALGLLFLVLGAGCALGSCAAFFVAIKKKADFKIF